MSSNPEYIGPGYWASWHIKSLIADTYEKKSEVSRSISVDINNFPCMECRNHAINYVKENKLLDAVNDKDPLSLFKWTVDFHNSVNIRLGKPMINIIKAKKMWHSDNFCLDDCTGDKKVTNEINIRGY